MMFSTQYDYVDKNQLLKELQISKLYPDEKSSSDRMQNERREFKYVIPYNSPQTIAAIRRFILCHLSPDEFTTIAFVRELARAKSDPIPDFSRLSWERRQHFASEIKYNSEYDLIPTPGQGYLVHSIYLDDFSRITVRQTEQGWKNRFKLRIRFYDDDPDGFASLEVKERRNQIILKSRAFVPKKIAEAYLNDPTFKVSDSHLVSNCYKEREGLANFLHYSESVGARPSRYTSYYRVGYEKLDNNEVRVTFDRDVRGAKYTGRLDATQRRSWPLVEFGGTVLELKFCESPPWWMAELCQHFDLQRGSAAKYVGSVIATDHDLLLKQSLQD